MAWQDWQGGFVCPAQALFQGGTGWGGARAKVSALIALTSGVHACSTGISRPLPSSARYSQSPADGANPFSRFTITVINSGVGLFGLTRFSLTMTVPLGNTGFA